MILEKLLKRRKTEDPSIRTVRIRKGLRTYSIPVGADGTVPDWALAQRFQQVGRTDDLRADSSIILPAGCTPEELIDWWIDPSSCDVRDVDTQHAPMYDVSMVPESKRPAQRRMAVIADPEEAARIRRILSESFTAEELESMAANGAVVIRAVGDMGDSTGLYLRRQDGVDVPLIMLENGASEDTVVHEMVHHLRAVEPGRKGILRTAYPSDRAGRLREDEFRRLSKRQQEDIQEQEERTTVAETVARTGTGSYSGYYSEAPGGDPERAYVHDQYVVKQASPDDIRPEQLPRLKGRAARAAVVNGYEYMTIARTRILDRDVKKKR